MHCAPHSDTCIQHRTPAQVIAINVMHRLLEFLRVVMHVDTSISDLLPFVRWISLDKKRVYKINVMNREIVSGGMSNILISNYVV